MKKTKAKPNLAADLHASLREALRYARGEKTDVVVHHVVPSHSAARRARLKLGLPHRAERQ